MITEAGPLRALVARARQAPAVALDTEFVWERTFYPRLGVVQLGLGRDDVHLLDGAALDLSPLGELLADPAVTKVLHDAGQDLTILRRASGADPVNVFDTQLAAGFVGLGASVSLQALFEGLLGVRLAKGATRSDWLRRPLSAEQTAYAEDDVRYLLDAYAALRERLAARGRTAWAEEEMRAYDDPRQYEDGDPRERYLAVRGKGKRGFGGREYAVLRELAAWREEEARKRDRPRGHVLSDDALVELAQRAPTSPERLRKIRALADRDAERYGDALLEAIQRGLETPKEDQPGRADRPDEDASQTPRLDLVQALIRGRAQRDDVDPALVANRTDVERLVAGGGLDPDRHPVLRGWRRDFIGEALEDLLAGRAGVALDEAGLPQFIPLQPSR
jgi:ribonuclease D